MCNAWNHSPGCNCGWGGGSNGGGWGGGSNGGGSNETKDADAETYPTSCWWCGETVFYHTNGFGDSVLFDSLGSPWEVHSCWKNYWNQERSQRPGREHSNSVENSLILQTSDIEQRNRLIFTGAIKHLRKTQILITEIQVANYLGFSLEIFREIFFHLYFYSSRLGNTYVIRMR